MPNLNHSELWRQYEASDTADKDHFAEQRSNVLIMAGDHYTKKNSKYWNRIREAKDISSEQKIRLTKNHSQKIVKGYENIILSTAPGVTPIPSNPSELRDQKAAELHKKAITHGKKKLRFAELNEKMISDFCELGEVGGKFFFDGNKGRQVGFEAQVIDGEPVVDEMGQPVPDEEKPVHAGEILFEKFYGFNLLRPEGCENLSDAPWLMIRKMVNIKEMRKKYEKDPEKSKLFEEGTKDTYIIFDASKQQYGATREKTLYIECYYKPSLEYPNGYYYHFTEKGVVEEGELPYGIFPICYAGFEFYATMPRGKSHIRIFRPFQVEINRCASRIAQHQITLGDDKLVTLSGTKVSAGATLPGIRQVTVTGAAPTIIAGRDGSQFIPHMEGQISEMYRASLLAEKDAADESNQVDPNVIMYRAASQKKKFRSYIVKYEQYLKDFWGNYLEMMRKYYDDETLLEIFGGEDVDNIPEFRSPDELAFSITLEPQSDDIESKMGMHFTLMQTLQYAGGKLEREDIGKFLKNMPYGNFKQSFDDLTMHYDRSVNVILSLDRGDPVKAFKYDDPAYMMKRLITRMSQPDFKLLPPEAQQNYEMLIQEYEQIEADRVEKAQALKDGFIPTGGAMIVCDMYVNADPSKPESSKRVRVPYEALAWMIQKLNAQGSTLDRLEQMNAQSVSQISEQVQRQPQQSPQGSGGSMMQPMNQGGMLMQPRI